jgi:hypothetical protein
VAVAYERPETSDVQAALANDPQQQPGTRDPIKLTHAEAHALSRCAPLKPAKFKELGELADAGISPLPHL